MFSFDTVIAMVAWFCVHTFLYICIYKYRYDRVDYEDPEKISKNDKTVTLLTYPEFVYTMW